MLLYKKAGQRSEASYQHLTVAFYKMVYGKEKRFFAGIKTL